MVNHSALVLAKADDENYNLSKYCKKVLQQLEEDNEWEGVDLEQPWGSQERDLPSSSQVERLMHGIY